MRRVVKKLPIPIVGLMLALAATGNLVLSYGNLYRSIFGGLSAIILLLVLMKIIMFPREVLNSLDNPMVASVFPTFSMGIMLLATYIKPFQGSLAYAMWLAGLFLHIILIFYFTKKYVLDFNIKKVFPSWFIVYVGIAVASISAPAFDKAAIGKIIFLFGLASYFLLLPTVLKRVRRIKEIPEPALPSLAIFAAPVALCLAGYISSYQEKSMVMIWILLALSQLSYFWVLLQLPKLLKLKFYPSYSAFTFPMVISAVSLKLTNGFLVNVGRPIGILKYLVKFEEFIGVFIVLYVLLRYINFIFSKSESEKTTS